MTDVQNAQIVADATPAKAFFIYMLTRDVSLSRAIIDLVDNSVDGATRLRPNDGDLTGFEIKIQLDDDRFTIEDNCGGITLEVARDYAFRFGRPSDFRGTPHSIGQFGVGMKRTLFKLGYDFRITSVTSNEKFAIQVNVHHWVADTRPHWEFPIQLIEKHEKDIHGTKIEVTDLARSVHDTFALEEWRTKLAREISVAHALKLKKGLKIYIGKTLLEAPVFDLIESDKIKPVTVTLKLEEPLPDEPDGEKYEVEVKIVAGVVNGKRELEQGGWTIFCNGRVVMDADHSLVTGWGDQLPKYHPDYVYFRGFVFFDSQQPACLPWTTTKTGVNSDSPVFKSVRVEMTKAALPITVYLRKLAEARQSNKDEDDSGNSSLLEIHEAAPRVAVDKVRASPSFVWPKEPTQRRAATERRISYTRPAAQVERVRAKLGVKSLKDVGEETFNYFLAAECSED